MSFILEQLKKSGKKRQIELVILEQMKKSKQNQECQSVSDLNTLTEPLPQKQRKYKLLFYIILASIVIPAGIFIWQQRPLHSEKSNNTPQTFFVNKQIPGKSESIKGINTINKPALITENVKTETGTQKILINKKKSLKTLPIEQKPDTITYTLSYESQASNHDESDKAAEALDFNELPLSVRKNLPEIKITAHLYNKESRLVSINGRILTEGYNMGDGLSLDEITPGGVILTYGKYRFHVKAY